MQRMLQMPLRVFARLMREQRGASAIEYAMIAAGIAVVIVVAVNSLGVTVNDMYESVKNALPS